jgi:hypothetical protein
MVNLEAQVFPNCKSHSIITLLMCSNFNTIVIYNVNVWDKATILKKIIIKSPR